MYVLLVLFGVALARLPVARPIQAIKGYKDFLNETRAVIPRISLEERIATCPKAKIWENSGRFEGDILLDDIQANALLGSYASRIAYVWSDSKWPQNTVIFEIASQFGQFQISAIMNAIQDIEQNTCIKFRGRNAADRNYVRISGNQDGCYANIGYGPTRGIHVLNLAAGCFGHTTIVHEMMHVIGFVHMQSTYNRDDYVRVLWENVIPGMEHNFQVYSSDVVSNLGVSYEYASIMHYGPYGFSRNGLPTLFGIYDYNNDMGNQQVVTQLDWLRINRHYNCPGAWGKR